MAGSRTTKEVYPTKEKAEEIAQNALKAYPPEGYGTRTNIRQLSTGDWELSIYRYNSCD